MTDEPDRVLHLRYRGTGLDGPIRVLCRAERVQLWDTVATVEEATCFECRNRAQIQWWGPGPGGDGEATKEATTDPEEGFNARVDTALDSTVRGLLADAIADVARRAYTGDTGAIAAFARLTGSTIDQVLDAVEGVRIRREERS